jgi:hypothetical protein
LAEICGWRSAPTLPLPWRARARARLEAGNQRRWPADKVERWSIDRLIPYAKNARTHTDAQVAAIAASIKEWGWTSPALVGEDGGLIAGHARVLAARQLGIAEVPFAGVIRTVAGIIARAQARVAACFVVATAMAPLMHKVVPPKAPTADAH